jgi:lipoyl(octanoyl) transferase
MEFHFSEHVVPYPQALAMMRSRVEAMGQGHATELMWGLEHPPLYTAGTSADESDLRNPAFPVYATERGGKYTYHGPGQLVLYAMVDLNKRGMRDVRLYVQTLEKWCITVLAGYGLHAFQREGRVGIWVETPKGEAKIGAIGVRISRWVTWHGLSLNVCPDLTHFEGIVPCGIRTHGVTSLADLGIPQRVQDVFEAFRTTCPF